jgi:dolichyl-phosphate-mannose--protein O-mannosyl transferase
MSETPPKIPLHERPIIQWIVIISIVGAFVLAFFVWFKIEPATFFSYSRLAADFCYLHRFYFGTAIFIGLAYLLRRPIRRSFVRLGTFLSQFYVKILSFLMRPLVSKWETVLKQEVIQTQQAAVHYGQPVVIQHFTTGKYLTSLDGRYYNHPQGSGQQIVFGASLPDENSIWWIEGPHGVPLSRCADGKVTANTFVRIYHLASDQYLHSHPDESPSSSPGNIQREVSVSSQNNVQDNWKIDSSGNVLTGERLRFEHSERNQFLHSHDRVFLVDGRADSFEVTCFDAHNDDDLWILRHVDVFGLRVPSVPSAHGLVIYWASYGHERTYHNVTTILRNEVRDGSLSIRANQDRVGGHLVGDPCPGSPKILSVHYSDRGERKHKTAREGHSLELP